MNRTAAAILDDVPYLGFEIATTYSFILSTASIALYSPAACRVLADEAPMTLPLDWSDTLTPSAHELPL